MLFINRYRYVYKNAAINAFQTVHYCFDVRALNANYPKGKRKTLKQMTGQTIVHVNNK